MKDEKRKKNETDNNFKQCVFLDCFMRMRRKKGQNRYFVLTIHGSNSVLHEFHCGLVGGFRAVLLEQESVVKFLCEKLGFWRVCKVFYSGICNNTQL